MTRVTMAVLLALSAVLLGCVSADDVPPAEQRAHKLNKTIMCPVCPGESIDQSQNQLAAQMRVRVGEMIREGQTDDSIRAFFVDKYGPSVLLEPPREGFYLLAWLLPPVGVVVAALSVFVALRMMSRPTGGTAGDPALSITLTEGEREAYFSNIEAALGDPDDGPVSQETEPTLGPGGVA